MAVPKKRTGKSAQAKRRANWKASLVAVTKCSSCGADVPAHTVCPECGSYKGKVVSIKNPNYTASVEEPKKEVKTKANRTTKKAKAEVTEETKAEVVEEAKEEKAAEETTAAEAKAEEVKTEE